jgi:Lipase (class 3)
MRNKKLTLILLLFVLLSNTSIAQALKPGFDIEEYRQMMLISTRTSASENYYKKFPEPAEFKMIYQSKPIGLDNLWDFWLNNKGQGVISIRGTTEKPESWLANFYAAMVPAKGQLKLSETEVFNYHLADNPKAAVHVGWLLSTAFLSKEIIPQINQQYQNGLKEFLIVGHSQGGGIAYLLTSYLKGLQKENSLAKDIRFKTYCSAAPKPGNLYYAYEYEVQTQGGWAYNVVNAADWVPEVPISIQTTSDFNTINPFMNAKSIIKKQKFPAKLVLKKVYNELDKPTKKAQKNYEKYLGKAASKIIKQNIPSYVPPEYFKSNHYVRTGATIVLMPDEEYYKLYPNDPGNLFPHHFHMQYLYLLDKLQLN